MADRKRPKLDRSASATCADEVRDETRRSGESWRHDWNEAT
jgi:hypothetical protein